MAIPYRTAKFKSTNILTKAILDSTATFNSRQYFRLYSNIIIVQAEDLFVCDKDGEDISVPPER